METSEPYSRLAPGYEAVMAHVDYAGWAAHVRRLIERHHPGAVDILELGCGTGAMARELQPLGPPPAGYRYRATDASEAMLEVARARSASLPISFHKSDFREVPAEPQVDAVILVYDGLNYLLEEDDVRALLAGVTRALRSGGVFVFDQSTPANSLRNAGGFDDAGDTGAFEYVRSSEYDPAARLHRTRFRLRFPDGAEAREEHVQRAYSIEEMESLLAETPLTTLGAFHALTLRPARPDSERVHWVVQR